MALATALAALAAPAGAAAGTPRGGCYPAHTRTVAASARARVFQTRRVVQAAHVTFGCLYARGRPFRFFLPDFPTGYRPIVLAAPFVAYEAGSDCAAGFCDPNSVILQDLRNGRVRFADGPIRVADVTGLVLRRTGSLAWLGSTFSETGSTLHDLQVVQVERGGPQVVLDEGPAIAPGSLALAGTTLYWTDAGLPLSAQLR